MTTGKAKRGRPTKYRPEYCQKLVSYFDAFRKAFELVDVGNGRKRALAIGFPTFQEFAADIGVCRDTLWRWAHDRNKEGGPVHPEFFDAFMRARTRQAAILVKGGMAGAFDSRMAGLAAKNLIGWKDKLDVSPTDSGTSNAADLAKREALYKQARNGGWDAQQRAMQERQKNLDD